MKTIPIHCAIILTVFGALSGVGCASHHSQRTETSSDNGEPVEDVGGLTPHDHTHLGKRVASGVEV